MPRLAVTHVLPINADLGDVAFAGMERAVIDLVEGLTRHGVDAELLTLVHGSDRTFERKLEAMAARTATCWLSDRRPWWTGRKRLPFHATALMNAFRSRRGRLFHLHQPNTDILQVLAARPFASRLVSTQHSATSYFRDQPNLRRQARLNDWMIDRYIAVSDAVNDVLVRDVGIASAKIELIDYGIPAPTRTRTRAEMRRSLGLPEEGFVVGYVGRLADMKNIDVLIDAAALVPELKLAILGAGPERTSLEDRARCVAATNVTFCGWRDDSRELVAALDLIALVSDFEGKPLTMIEAMLGETPVLGSDVAGTRDALGHGEWGQLVPPRDADAVANAFRAAMRDTTVWRGRALRARAHAESAFSVDNMASKVIDLYERVLHA